MSKINLTPLADRVIVEVAAAEEKTASGSMIRTYHSGYSKRKTTKR